VRRGDPVEERAGASGTGRTGGSQADEPREQWRQVLAARVRTLLGDPAVARRIHEGVRKRAGRQTFHLPGRLADFCRDDRGGLWLSAWAEPAGAQAGADADAAFAPAARPAGVRARLLPCAADA